MVHLSELLATSSRGEPRTTTPSRLRLYTRSFSLSMSLTYVRVFARVCADALARIHALVHAHTPRRASCCRVSPRVRGTPVYTSVCTREKRGTSPCSDHTRDDVTPGRRVAWITRDGRQDPSLSLSPRTLRDSRPLIIGPQLSPSFSRSQPHLLPSSNDLLLTFRAGYERPRRTRERERDRLSTRGHPLDS